MAAVPLVPDGYLAITPWAIVDRAAEFMLFLAEVFQATEDDRQAGPDGKIVHAEMRISGAPLMLFDRREGWGPTPSFLRVYVEDLDRLVERATAAGCVVVTPAATWWFGDRSARLRDPWDNLWWVHQRMFEPSAEQIAAAPTADQQELMSEAARTLDAEMRRRRTS